MALGFIKNILKKRKTEKKKPSGMLEPTGSVKMHIPITFTVTQSEIDEYGFSPYEQVANNERIRNMLKKCIT